MYITDRIRNHALNLNPIFFRFRLRCGNAQQSFYNLIGKIYCCVSYNDRFFIKRGKTVGSAGLLTAILIGLSGSVVI